MTEIQRIKYAAWQIATDPRASRIERIEALKLVCAAKGILLPELDERFLSVKQITQLRRAKQALVEKALKRKERKRRANRKAYIRRRLKAEAQAESGPTPQEGN